MNADVVRELVIEGLGVENAELREHISSLEADIRVYRELAQAALDKVHTQQRRIARLDDENRGLRRAAA